MHPRIGVGGIWHETNTFSNAKTSLQDFQAYQFAEGNELLSRYAGVRNEMGGFIEGSSLNELDLVPSFYAAAVPSGVVERSAYEFLKRKLIEGLRLPLNGVLLALHGAMVAEGVDDVEADLLASVRQHVHGRPIVATFDYHANLSSDMVENCDLLVGYDTYPHTDPYDRAMEAASLLSGILTKGQRPVCSYRKLPLLTVPQTQATDCAPMNAIFGKVWEAEKCPRILTITAAAGYPYSDVSRLGFSVVVYADGDQEAADRHAHALAESVWSARHDFRTDNVPVFEAVRRAIHATDGPVILVDVADNIGGGSPGDGTTILRELLDQRARSSVVTIADPESVAAAIQAGVRQEIQLCIGGKHDRNHGAPVAIRGRVRLISDGVYIHRGSYMTGQRSDMGRTAVVEADGVEIVLMERPAMPFDAEQLRSLGIEPRLKKIITVKSAIAWRAAYGDVARQTIYVSTPGICSSNLNTFTYRNVPRPIFPLDEI